MKIIINGESHDVAENQILSELLLELDLQHAAFAIAVNDSVVPKSQYKSTNLNSGDRVELVRAVGGG